MYKTPSLWLSTGLALSASIALAQPHVPVPSIAQATWSQYRDQYRQSPVCTADEITLWTCESKQKVFSLCSSREASRTTGYLQYRASNAGNITFAYPATKRPPLGLFTFISYGNGNASVAFANGGYRYTLWDPIMGRSSIDVEASGPSGKTTEIACGPNQTLQVNYTLRLMHDFGISALD